MNAKRVCSEPGTTTRANLSVMLTLTVGEVLLADLSRAFFDLGEEICPAATRFMFGCEDSRYTAVRRRIDQKWS